MDKIYSILEDIQNDIIEIKGSLSARPVTNYEYEDLTENNKRSIYILKKEYLSMLFNDLEDIMPYKKGSGGYVSRSLKKGDNPRLYN